MHLVLFVDLKVMSGKIQFGNNFIFEDDLTNF